jgi:AAA domain-containing protein
MSAFKMFATGSRQDIDVPMVRQALRVLADPAQGVQLQAAPAWAFSTFAGTALDSMTEWVQGHSDATGIYYALNPVPADLPRRVLNGDPVTRRWLLFDVDRAKTTEDADLSATDEQHEAARELAAEIVEWLSSFGWPAPVLIDSGNGWHLLYRLDLPNDAITKARVRKLLHSLASRFDGPRGSIGKECHDARRIAKLPGTWARRGPSSPGRPHRLCRLVFAPDPVAVVQLDMLEVDPAEEAVTHPGASAWAVRATGESTSGYAAKALDLECARVHTAKPGERNNALNRAGYSIGQLVGGKMLDYGTAFNPLYFAARQVGLEDAEIQGTLPRALRDGAESPRVAPERNGVHAGPAIEPGTCIIVRASEVTPRKVEWLWPGRIPLGKMTTFAGIGGLGKTFVLCDIASRVSRGADWPDGEKCEQGLVLFVSGEDDIEDTLVPRLIEAGADLSKVVFLKSEVQDVFTLADLSVLKMAIDQAGPSVRFVAIDPPTAYLGDVDDHKNAELRGLLSPLKTWAADNRLAMVFNTHVNKPQGTKVEAMMRVMGSVAWVNAVRAAHMFAKDPEDHTRRLMVGMKLNIGKERKGLAYRITDTDTLARVEWLGEVDTTADEAVNRDRQARKRSVKAAEWLEELFSNTDQLPSKEIWDRQKAETTISDNALKEAKDDMGFKARQLCDPDGTRCWFWVWPPEARERWGRRTAEQPQQDGEEERDVLSF